MAEVEIYRCKYLLPCGYCDKYDIPCKAKKEDVYNFYNTPLEEDIKECDKDTNNCDHDWHYEGAGFDNSSSAYERHRCSKCGMVKEFQIIEL